MYMYYVWEGGGLLLHIQPRHLVFTPTSLIDHVEISMVEVSMHSAEVWGLICDICLAFMRQRKDLPIPFI